MSNPVIDAMALADELHTFCAAAPHDYPGHNIELFERVEKFLRAMAQPAVTMEAEPTALEQYKNDWRRNVVEVFGPAIHTEQLDRFIALAELNGLFDPVIAALPSSNTAGDVREASAKIASDFYTTIPENKRMLRANNKAVGEKIAEAILSSTPSGGTEQKS